MNNIVEYRDDGPLVDVLGRAPLRLPAPPVWVVAAGVAVLLAGLVVDGADTSGWTLAGVAVLVLAGGASRAGAPDSSLGWLVPALLRAAEYGLVVWLAWRAGGGALPVAYGLLAALAFHHYDIVYRIRHQRVPPPAWLGRLGGGWELRLAVLAVAAAAGELRVVMTVVAVWSALLYVSESVASWVAVARDEQRTILAGVDQEDEV